jgi:hypothetical protein
MIYSREKQRIKNKRDTEISKKHRKKKNGEKYKQRKIKMIRKRKN